MPLRLSVNHSNTFKVTILRSTLNPELRLKKLNFYQKDQHHLKIKTLSDFVDCLLRY